MPQDRIIDIYWGNETIDLGFASANGIKAIGAYHASIVVPIGLFADILQITHL